ncbi:sigma-54 dependent transcriptional regulator [Colwellia sp. MSW7]|uniref:Sigma-54 dependent transcriptional regulator n=1 Tax=Colwellia maritima TaxID=2912588 RepID=A0ABS9X5K1_9GAMM|nr:sigma-54 dependent transcriptional regulator [Colwellia maritima]MCI2285508.1 sigma-54 dependent transcriptional regulator [Colwellia maritima]
MAENNLGSVFIVDDEQHIRSAIEQLLELENYDVRSFSSAKDLLANIDSKCPDVIISDINMPVMDGHQLMANVFKIDRELPIILLTGFGDISMAVNAIKNGAYDFIEKPFNNEHLIDRVKRAIDKRALTLENRALKKQLVAHASPGPRILGNSPVIVKMRNILDSIMDAPADIMLNGETGTGKELVARYLHDHSIRKDHNFVALNCGAIPENIIESELFGAESGAFTGADKRRIGKFEYANGGTIFLDEIESTPMSLQVKLLRVLEDRQVVRLGSNHSIPLDIRVIAATKIDLLALCEQGEFRHDLYFRLNLVDVNIPPLRERKEDIPLLFLHFARIASTRYSRELIPLSQQNRAILLSNDWLGNVRELRNLAERYVLLGEDAAFETHQDNSTTLHSNMVLSERVGFFEKTLIQDALHTTNGCIKDTMEMLSLPRKTLYDKMKKYGLQRKETE